MNEKTLELNVVKDLIDVFENYYRKRIIALGTTLSEEGINGVDSSLYGKRFEFFFMQFKAPKRKNIFYINNNRAKNQHKLLLQTALCEEGFVVYAFPNYVTGNELLASGNSLTATYFIDVTSVKRLSPKWHKVEIKSHSGRAIISSEPQIVPLLGMSQILEKISWKSEGWLKDIEGVFKQNRLLNKKQKISVIGFFRF